MVAAILHTFHRRVDLFSQTQVQDRGADEAAEDHRGVLDFSFEIRFFPNKQLEENEGDQEQLAPEGQYRQTHRVQPLGPQNLKQLDLVLKQLSLDSLPLFLCSLFFMVLVLVVLVMFVNQKRVEIGPLPHPFITVEIIAIA